MQQESRRYSIGQLEGSTYRGIGSISRVGDRSRLWRPLQFFLIILALQGFIQSVLFSESSAYGIYYRPTRVALYLFLSLTLLRVLIGKLKLSGAQNFGASAVIAASGIFVVVVFIGAWLGRVNGNPGWRGDTIALLELAPIVPAVYIIVGNITAVRYVLKPFLRLMGVLAFFHIAAYVLQLFRVEIFRVRIEWLTLVLLLGYCIYLARLLTVARPNWRDFAMVLLFAGGSLITFHKPIVWSWGWSTGFMIALALWRRASRRSLGRLTIMAAILAGTVWALDALAPVSMLQRYRSIFYYTYLRFDPVRGYFIGDPSGGRLYLWKLTWSLFLRNPILGQGLGVGLELHEVIIVHNLYLYFLASVGIIGSLVILGLFIGFFVTVFRGLRFDSDMDLKLGLAGYVAAVLAYNTIGMMLFFAPVVYLFGVVMGLLLKVSALQERSHDPGSVLVE